MYRRKLGPCLLYEEELKYRVGGSISEVVNVRNVVENELEHCALDCGETEDVTEHDDITDQNDYEVLDSEVKQVV